MKISYASDLHIEAGNVTLTNNDNSDVLVLAGDICVSSNLKLTEDDWASEIQSERIHNFFRQCSKEFKHIVYVVGNHEHYNGRFEETVSNLKKHLFYIKNLHILDNTVVQIEDVLFVGATMWTSIKNNCSFAKNSVQRMMNDFRIIHVGDRRFTADDAVKEFHETYRFIDLITNLHKYKKIVVVTHHTPSFKSVSPQFEMDFPMNYGYHSDCEYLMKKNVIAWICGHTHARHSYYIGNTLVTNNARGYTRFEECAKTFELKTIDTNDMPSSKDLKEDQYWLFHPKGDLMKHPFDQVKNFMIAGDHSIDGSSESQIDLYAELVREESKEFWDGIANKNDLETLDGIADTIWVLVGYAHSRGWDINGAFNEVARSNMSKVDIASGKLLKREDGKVLKPETYSPPDLKEFLN
jgi:Icc-related predicted phosphoesterase/NTP pyrophosphatase (non-canonical NTP hydrolase)